MATNGGRTGKAWNDLVAWVRATHPPICRWCGHPINMALSGRHPYGPSVDHIIALADGGQLLDPHNVCLVHMRCNAAKEGARRKRDRSGRNSRRWT